jgi:nicotinamide-nucleotide amidase
MPGSNLRQADVPKGAEPIGNPLGSAPGLIASLGEARVYAVPGVPGEMRDMMERVVLPRLREAAGRGVISSRVLRLTGIGESAVAELLDDLFTGSTNPTVAYLASMGEVKVRLTAKAPTHEGAGRLLAPVADEVAARLGDAVFTTEDETLEEVVLRLLRGSDRTLACAESLTGGSVSARLAGPPGASASLRGGVVAYQEDVKADVLGVSVATLEGPGVVSAECAAEMAAGVRRLLRADVGIALTGVAGPERHGGHPPGTVWIALDADDVAHARGLRINGERERVVRWSQQAALDLARRYLDGVPLPTSSTTI